MNTLLFVVLILFVVFLIFVYFCLSYFCYWNCWGWESAFMISRPALTLLPLALSLHKCTVSAQYLHTHHRLQNTHSMESDQSDVSKKVRKPRRSGLELLATEPADSPLPRRSRNPASPIPPPSSSPSPSPTYKRKAEKFLPGSSSRRPSYYLLGSAPLSLSDNKLPKIKAVLARILAQSDADTGKHRVEDAIQKVIVEIKDIWTLHFHPQWISGDRDTETIIYRDDYIANLLHGIYNEWLLLESDSRRPHRNNTKNFLEKKKNFEEKVLKKPGSNRFTLV